MEPFIGQIIMFGGNFAPRNWAFCDGQLLAISSHSSLFSILGTTYGGDGRTTFALPDLRGRVSIHPGNGPGLTEYRLGQRGGQEDVTLTAQQMPSHNHSPKLHGEETVADNGDPAGRMLALTPNNFTYGAPVAADNRPMASESITSSNVGGNMSHTNIQPYECVNYIIALQGVYPSRS